MVGPDEVFLLAAAHDDSEETTDTDCVENAGDAVDDVPRAADNHVTVDDSVDTGQLEVAYAGFEDVDGEDGGRDTNNVLLLEGREIDNEPSQDRSC